MERSGGKRKILGGRSEGVKKRCARNWSWVDKLEMGVGVLILENSHPNIRD